MFERLLIKTAPLRFGIDGFLFRRTKHCEGLRALENRYSGKPLLVIGNGPSLNKTPLDDFGGVASIGMNKINLLFDRVRWRPSLIIAVNFLVIQQNQQFFAETDLPVYVSWKSRWLLRRENRSRIKYFSQHAHDRFSTDITSGVGTAGTVTYAALQFAYYCGANPVILFGVDHSFKFEGKPNEIKRAEGPDSNHFDPNYFSHGMSWGLPNLERSELAYSNAKKAFESAGRVIYDATIGGKLRIFPKLTVAEVKRLCGKKGAVPSENQTTQA